MYLINTKLLVQNWNIIIVLSLIKIPSHWCSQIVLWRKLFDWQFVTVFDRSIAYAWLVKIQLRRLFEYKNHVTMKTGFRRWSGTYECGERFSAVHVSAKYVSYQPFVFFGLSSTSRDINVYIGITTATTLIISVQHKINNKIMPQLNKSFSSTLASKSAVLNIFESITSKPDKILLKYPYPLKKYVC